jgi:uncharacterized protein (TIGR03083 family)
MTLPAGRYLDQLRSDAAAMAAAARRGRLDAPVPACPGWDLHELLAHTSGVHRWVTAMVSEGAQAPVSRRDMAPAPDGPAVIDWFEEGADALVQALSEAGTEKAVWNWTDSPRSYFWFRRQAQETAVHRWDAQSASGTGEPIPVDLAIDGLDELITMWVPDPDFAPNGPWLVGSLHIHATDGDGEWTLTPGPDVVEVEATHDKADAAVRGPASDLLLFLWNRSAPVETFGDPAVLASWQETLRI